MTRPRILLAAGGTGGHIYPALALGRELESAHTDVEVLYCCGARANERKIYEGAGIEPLVLPVEGPRRGVAGRAAFLGQLARSYRAARREFALRPPDLAVGFGNYSSVPALLAARRGGATLALHEQNVHPGRANRWLAPAVRAIFTGMAGTEAAFGRASGRVIRTGNPLRPALLAKVDRAEARRALGLPAEGLVALCFGGSLGAAGINRMLESALGFSLPSGPKSLDRSGAICNSPSQEMPPWHFLWVTGHEHHAAIIDRLASGSEQADRVTFKPYIDSMELAWAAADLAVTRAGAMTISEITALGKPSVLIPLPRSAGDHQRKNALGLSRAGAAILIEEEDPGSAGFLRETLAAIAADSGRREEMARRALALGRPDAGARLRDEIVRLLR